MKSRDSEREVLQNLRADLEAAGYEFLLEPGQPLLPTFLAAFRPDAVALKEDDNLVIEITSGTKGEVERIEKLRTALQGHAGWNLRLVSLPRDTGSDLPVLRRTDFGPHLYEIRELVTGNHLGAALLLAWATFEAISRALLNDEFARPQTPARLIEVLASHGYLLPDDADSLRTLAKTRNRFIHGDLGGLPRSQDIVAMVGILENLLAAP
jgi:hypothetical protein